MAKAQFPEGERIQLLLDNYKTKASAFEAECGLAGATVFKAMTAGTLTRETAIRICKRYPEVSLSWLISGEGDMFVPPQSQTDIAAAINRMASAIERLCTILEQK